MGVAIKQKSSFNRALQCHNVGVGGNVIQFHLHVRSACDHMCVAEDDMICVLFKSMRRFTTYDMAIHLEHSAFNLG